MTQIYWKTILIVIIVVVVLTASSPLAADLKYEEYVLEVQNQVYIPCMVKLVEHVGLGDMIKGLEGEQLEEVLFSDEMKEMLRYQLGDRRYMSHLKQMMSFYDSLYDKVRDKPQPMRRVWYNMSVSKCS